ncbi:MAG: hypothetical protein E6K73_07655 [Candidatus Eisenbacteria bacterium]|uniref:Ig-like domain-containing protein n=1 Tax=Eiseniibacteriota bacterium TaxID=2212470 RepID=A0A538SGP8_UNCEI|nr:MAG: hypothetical protein E6K73_07655 [Candidatus Eisenbacteria bacterium]
MRFIRRLVIPAAVAAWIIAGAGPRMAAANDLSTDPCTAGDVEIVGAGVVVNEPCSCAPGSMFNAQVKFTVRNNTSTGRYCIALHLIPDGGLITTPLDVILRDANSSSTAPGKSGGESFHDTDIFGTIPNFTCNTGQVCFGQSGATRGKCAPNTCTTISWNTSPGAAGCTTADQNPPGGQCRHQQVCVIGYGATLSCIANCGVSCGATATLQGCVKSPTNRGPFTLTLAGNDGSSQTQSTFGDPSGTTCMNFSVTPSRSPTTTYTLTVTDKDGCTRTATTSLDVRAQPTAGAGPDQAKCSTGSTTPFTLAGSASNGTPAWSVVSGPATIADPSSLNSSVTFTGSGTATLRLTVTNPPCPPATDEVVLDVAVTTVTITPPGSPACNGVLRYTASVDGRTDCPFTWTIDGQSLASFAPAARRMTPAWRARAVPTAASWSSGPWTAPAIPSR